MAGCAYCGEPHSVHYRCDARRKAEAAAVNKPKAAVNRPAVNTRRGSYPNTDARRTYMRGYMAKRRQGLRLSETAIQRRD
jgi:hypothetical protein